MPLFVYLEEKMVPQQRGVQASGNGASVNVLVLKAWPGRAGGLGLSHQHLSRFSCLLCVCRDPESCVAAARFSVRILHELQPGSAGRGEAASPSGHLHEGEGSGWRRELCPQRILTFLCTSLLKINVEVLE